MNMRINKEIAKIVSDISDLGKYLWEKGWAERNAGNISVNITEHLTDELRRYLTKYPSVGFDLETRYPGIGGCFFIVTGTGKRMRDLGSDPERNIIMLRINDKGTRYHILSQGVRDSVILPTSEFPTHLTIHEHFALTGSRERAVLHTHPNELISITQISQYCEEQKLNRLLWGMHPETIVIVPEGAGFLPYQLPGTREIAMATLQKFENHKVVIWEKHGSLAIGKDVFEAFDLIDTLAKSARIYFQCKSAGHEPEGLSDDKILELKELSKKFLPI